MTTWTLRALSLVLGASLAVGCNNGDDKTDDDSDADETDTTETESGGDSGGSSYNPDQIGYSLDFAIDADGAIHNFTVDGTEAPSAFYITITDGRDDCVMQYTLNPEAFAHIGMLSDTGAGEDVPEGLLEFLDDNGLLFGFKIDAGLFTGAMSAQCDELPEGFFGEGDPFETALGFGDPGGIFVGFNDSPEASVVSDLEDAGSTIDEANLLGGIQKFPFEFTNAAGATTEQNDVAGIAGEIDEAFEVQSDDAGNLVLLDADEVWDAEAMEPNPGYYRLIALYGFRLSSN